METLAAKLREGIEMYNLPSEGSPWDAARVAQHRISFPVPFEEELTECYRPHGDIGQGLVPC